MNVLRFADDVPTSRISTLLEPEGRVDGMPDRLSENTGIAFIGSNVNCVDEFTLTSDDARQMISAEPHLAAVIHPFLGGEDVNQRPACDARRWIVDFTGHSEEEIKAFGAAYNWTFDRVRPARGLLTNKPSLQTHWWIYERPGYEMRSAVRSMDEVLVIALVSKTVMPVRVSARQVFSHKLAIFATTSYSDQAVLSSSIHQMWAIRYGSTMRADVNYSPSDVFLTFPRPATSNRLAKAGKRLNVERHEIMLKRDLGLTKLYNLVNDPDTPDTSDADVARLRAIHIELDEAVMAAYGWSDVPLEHGFHTYRQMQRWTVSPAARVEILDQLLEENHRRAALQSEVPPPAEAESEGEDE
jgi:hypothetical protein